LGAAATFLVAPGPLTTRRGETALGVRGGAAVGGLVPRSLWSAREAETVGRDCVLACLYCSTGALAMPFEGGVVGSSAASDVPCWSTPTSVGAATLGVVATGVVAATVAGTTMAEVGGVEGTL